MQMLRTNRPATVLLINLDRSTERLAFMHSQPVYFERIPGVDGADGVPAWLKDEFSASELTSGEIGCYASHLVCAREIVCRCLPYAIVLEDDVTLDDDFLESAVAAADAAPVGWDYIHLSSHFKRSVIWTSDLPNGRSLVRHARLPVNTAAYILSNAGARKWLRPRRRVRPNDLDVRYGWIDDLEIYGVFPSAASQRDNFPSEIGGTHGGKLKIHDPRDFSPGVLSLAVGGAWMIRKVGALPLLRARVASVANSLRRRRSGERHIHIVR